jgi:hypothetical protein
MTKMGKDMKPEPFEGHEIEHRFYSTERQSGLKPYHFKPPKQPYDAILLLVGICVILGACALAVFAIEALRQ